MFFFAALSGFFAVCTGAFGAHGLEKILDSYSLKIWHTAVEYQMWHSLAILGLACFESITKQKMKLARFAFLFGILLFSGSLYVLALTGIKILGMITPFGGILFLIGWLNFALAGWKYQSKSN